MIPGGYIRRRKFSTCLASLAAAARLLAGAPILAAGADLPESDSPYLGASRGGKVVWWGMHHFLAPPNSEHTNGVLELEGRMLTNVVGVAAFGFQGFALRGDGSVEAFGADFGAREAVAGLSNVVSISSDGYSLRAKHQDGSLSTPVGGFGEQAVGASVALLGNGEFVELRPDGRLVGVRLRDSYSVDPVDQSVLRVVSAPPRRRPVTVNGQELEGVVDLVSLGNSLFVLRQDASVLHLERATSRRQFQFDSAEVMRVNGRPLTNVMSLTRGIWHVLALNRDGTVSAWGSNEQGESSVPPGLSNVVTVAAAQRSSLALKRDGTVVAWGGNSSGQVSIPVGLSNVVAIAAADEFSLAVTTGAVPASVWITPHGRIEKLEREVDLVFKGRVLSTEAVTNTAFPYWGKPHVTRFEIISKLKGNVSSNRIAYHHLTSGPDAWGGGTPPSHFTFESNQCYLVFAVQAGKPGWLYSPASNFVAASNEFRQPMPGDYAVRTLDARPIEGLSPKETHWAELNRLLEDDDPVNQLYAIRHLNALSQSCLGAYGHTDDFQRPAVLKAVLPLVTSSHEGVAVAAIGCFQVGGNTGTFVADRGGWILRGAVDVEPGCVTEVEPYAESLIAVAENSVSVRCRVAAIAAFSCTGLPQLKRSLTGWLRDPSDVVRVQAVLLLPDFEEALSVPALREMAMDPSPNVRAAVAMAIGNGRIVALLPTLQKLWTDPVGRGQPVRIDLDALKEGGWGDSSGDVHSSVGYALLKFDVEQVSEFLRANISDEGFGLSFVRKLSQDGAETYLSLLTTELKAHTANSEQEAAENGFHWPLSYWLSGNYGWAWETLFSHVSSQTREALANPEFSPMLDALAIADDPGDARTLRFYDFLLDRGMIERALTVRRGITRRTEDPRINKASFNFPKLLKAFDEIDQKHSFEPDLDSPVPR